MVVWEKQNKTMTTKPHVQDKAEQNNIRWR